MAEENNNWYAGGDQNAQPQTADGASNTTSTSNTNDDSNEQPTVALPTTPDNGEQPTVQMTPAPAAPAAPAAPEPSANDVPNYAAAAGETTVVSNDGNNAAPQGQPASESASGPYRPAPEYGAYGPTPTANQPAGNAQPQGQQNPQGQPTQPFGGLFGQGGPFGQPQGTQQNGAGRNPYGNPFLAGQQPQQGAPNQQQNNGGYPPMPPFGQNPGQPGQPGQPAGKSGAKTANGVIVAVVAALVSAALCLGIGWGAITYGWITVPTSSSLSSVNSNKSGSGTATTKSGEAVDWTSVASSVSDSVVSITTTLSNGEAKGSGAILDTEGHIVTNNHVISGAQSIQVTLANGNMYTATVVGTDTTTDLAVIKLQNPPSDLKAVTFADSDELAVGEAVMAIGNPLGYDDTATTGIVSALNRPVTVTDDNNNEIFTNAVQIDAAINPGNSGGPTFNGAGQVIGINSSIASTASSSESAGSIGIGFAIPANLVKRVANEIIKSGSVTHVALGITVTTGTATADGVTRSGAKITAGTSGSAVVSGSPADKAGLKSGDTIVAFNGNAVTSHYALLGFVRAAALGDKATLTIVRNGKTMEVDVTLDQEESAVTGSSSSSGSSNGNSQNNNNGNGSNGYGYGNGNSNGNGNSDGGTGDNGGLSDPFGMW
ncbi:trypsin-like peptidase domain-containing protein [Bifidobacterium amazonense]|uniref:Trypsin-like peptidase domain-containing protein n=1 Tax=Bifidobacterium amazonense TaxID=2809027 RepID=A0ABS9VUE7_9BIFI|nr:trypsin-like peptidase domain-containing protein [Bifidobacterium amazonense]MCH9275699.1 trypsin-like peptidase domain-containing protein [Bifidobacterium amazonense]MCH9275717.1 trypsin-like peptidase domain-containing protein [Bifidobacterium amazonense]